MTINDVLKEVMYLLLDTGPIIYFVEQKPHHLGTTESIFSHKDNGRVTGVVPQNSLAKRSIAKELH